MVCLIFFVSKAFCFYVSPKHRLCSFRGQQEARACTAWKRARAPSLRGWLLAHQDNPATADTGCGVGCRAQREGQSLDVFELDTAVNVWEFKPWAAGSPWGGLSNIHRQFEGQQPCEPPEPVVWITSSEPVVWITSWKQCCAFRFSCPCRTTFRTSSIFCLCERRACEHEHGEGQDAIDRCTSAPDTTHKKGEGLWADCCSNGKAAAGATVSLPAGFCPNV